MINSARGFTLLELLVVIVLLVMFTTVASISIVSGQGSAQIKTSARELLSVLRSSRTRAIAEGVEAGITLGEENSLAQNTAYGHSVTSYQDEDLDQDAPGPDVSYIIVPLNETIYLPENMSLFLAPAMGSGITLPRSILFYPDGTSSGGRLLLTSPSGNMTIDINWLTGEVVLEAILGANVDLASATVRR